MRRIIILTLLINLRITSSFKNLHNVKQQSLQEKQSNEMRSYLTSALGIKRSFPNKIESYDMTVEYGDHPVKGDGDPPRPGSAAGDGDGPGTGISRVINVFPIKRSAEDLNVSITKEPEPEVTAVFPTIGPFYGNVPINIIGRGFGLKPANQSVSIGGVVCPSTRYISNELLKCDLPPGTGKNQEVTVSFENRKLSGGEIFSYQDGGPSITSVSPAVVPIQGGVTVVINGCNLGTPKDPPYAKICETDCQKITWVTSTKLHCVIPPGYVGSCPVTVHIGSSTIKAPSPLNYKLPIVSRILPTEGASFTRTLVSIHGVALGSKLSPPKVVFSSSDKGGAKFLSCNDMRFLSTELVQCYLGPGDPLNYLLSVKQGEQLISTKELRFRLRGLCREALIHHAINSPAPFIESVEPLHVSMVGNSAVTIKGMHLGSTVHMPYITVGDMPCLEVKSISSTRAICKTPPGFAGPHPIQLSVAGRTTEKCLCNERSKRCVTYHRPEIHGIRPRHGSILGGTELELKGIFFGQAPSLLSINVGGFECRQPTWVSPTSMHCITSTGKRGVFRVAFGPTTKCFDTMTQCEPKDTHVAIANAGVVDFTYDSPLIHSIAPSNGPTAGGTILTLSGEFFTQTAIVMVGESPCTGVVVHSEELITCATPPGMPEEVHVTVMAGPGFRPYICESCAKYLYEGLQVGAIMPSTGPFYGGKRVKVSGRNFASQIHVYFGKSECKKLRRLSETQVECEVPRGLPGIVDVSLTSSAPDQGHQIKTSLKYEYKVPTINSVTPFTGSICGGTIVTVRGEHFGTELAGTKTTVVVGELNCPVVKLVNEEEVHCKTDHSFFVSPKCCSNLAPSQVIVTVDSVCSVPDCVKVECGKCEKPPPKCDRFLYTAPQVFAVEPHRGPIFGGNQITIRGTDVGCLAKYSEVTVGNTACTKLVGGESDMKCTVASHSSAGDKIVFVALPKLKLHAPQAYTVENPHVHHIYPTHGRARGGEVVTLIGEFFGPAEDIEVKFGGVFATDIKILSEKTISCVLPKVSPTAVKVCLTAKGFKSPSSPNFVFDMPKITHILPTSGTFMGGTSVTVYGSNLDSVESVDVMLGAVKCLDVREVTQHSLKCTTPVFLSPKGVSVKLADATIQTIFGTTVLADGESGVILDGSVSSPSVATLPAETFTFLGPRILRVEPTGGSCFGGNTLTILGDHFGTVGTSPTRVTIGESTCTQLRIVSTHSMECTVPPSDRGLYTVRFTTAGVSSNLFKGYKYAPPLVTAIIPSSGPIVGNSLVTIAGENFGSVQQVIKINIGGEPCADVQLVREGQFICKTPPAPLHIVHTLARPIKQYTVTACGERVEHTPVILEDANVRIGDASPHNSASVDVTVANAPAGARGSRLSGVQFEYQGTSVEEFFPRHCTTWEPALSMAKIKDMSARCTVELHGKWLSLADALGVDSQSIAGAVAMQALPRVWIGGNECGGVEALSPRAIKCTVTPGPVSAKAHIVVAYGASAFPVPCSMSFKFANPRITQITPQKGPFAGGFSIVFDVTAPIPRSMRRAVRFWFGDRECVLEALSNDKGYSIRGQTISCALSSKPGTPGVVNVTVAFSEKGPRLQLCANCFIFEGPVISRVQPRSGPLCGGTKVTLSGSNLGCGCPTCKCAPPTVFFGQAPCTDVEVKSDCELTCVTSAPPAYANITEYLAPMQPTVKVLSMPATAALAKQFMYETPSIRSIRPKEISPVRPGVITITGKNLGCDSNSSLVFTPRIVDQNSNARYAVISASPSEVVFNVSNVGDSTDLTLQLEFDTGSQKLPLAPFVINVAGPVITEVSPRLTFGTLQRHTGTIWMSISGRHLGNKDMLPTIDVGNSPCDHVEVVVAEELLRCQFSLPSIPAADRAQDSLPVKVFFADPLSTFRFGTKSSAVVSAKTAVASASTTLKVAPPQVLSVTPSTGSIQGLDTIRIHGLGFVVGADAVKARFRGGSLTAKASSANPSTDLEVRIGGQKCYHCKVLNNTDIECLTPPLDIEQDLWEVEPDSLETTALPIVVSIGGHSSAEEANALWMRQESARLQPLLREPGMMSTADRPNPKPKVKGVLTKHAPAVVFQYETIVIEQVKPSFGSVAGGETVRVLGKHLGRSVGPLAPRVLVDGVPCVSVHHVSASELRCVTPPGPMMRDPSRTVDVAVHIAGSMAIKHEAFMYMAPRLVAIEPSTSSMCGGVDVQLTALYLPSTTCPDCASVAKGRAFKVSAFIGAFECPIRTAVRKFGKVSVVNCTVPIGADAGRYRVSLAVGPYIGMSSPRFPSATFFEYLAPELTGLSANTILDYGGQKVSIYGQNMFVPRKFLNKKKKNNPDFLWAAVGGVMCSSVELESDKVLTCTTGAAPLVGDPWADSHNNNNTLRPCAIGAEVSVCNIHRFGNKSFDYKQAQLFRNTPSGPPTGKFQLEIWGTGFPVGLKIDVKVAVGESRCTAVFLDSATHMSCEAPPGIPLTRVPITVSFGDTIIHSSSNGLWLQYDGVEIHRIKPNHCPTHGGKRVKLYGKYFSAIKFFNDTANTSVAADASSAVKAVQSEGQVLIGGFSCRHAVPVSDSMIVCECPPGTGQNLPVRMGVFSQNHTSAVALVRVDATPADKACNVTFNYDAPRIDSITPTSVEAAGGTRLTIVGENLGFVPEKGWEPIELIPSSLLTGLIDADTVHIHHEVYNWGQEHAYSWSNTTEAAWIQRLRKIFVSVQMHLRVRAEGVMDRAVDNDAKRLLARSKGEDRKKLYPFADQLTEKLNKTRGRVVVVASQKEEGFQKRSEDNLVALYKLLDQSVGVSKNRIRRRPPFAKHKCDNCNPTSLLPDEEVDTELLEMIEISDPSVGSVAPVYVTIFSTDPNRRTAVPCKQVLIVSSKQVECVVGPGIGTDNEVQISVGNVQATSTTLISFTGPHVTKVTPSHGPPRGGFNIRISGTDGSFGPNPLAAQSIRIFIGAAPCKSTHWLSPEEIECFSAPAASAYRTPGMNENDERAHAYIKFVKIPEKRGEIYEPTNSGVPVRVDVAGQLYPKTIDASDNVLFEFDQALILSIKPSIAPSAGGAVVTVSGYNFGVWAATGGASLQIDGRIASCTEWRLKHISEASELSTASSSSAFAEVPDSSEVEQLLCYVPPGIGNDHEPVLLVPTQQSKNPLGVTFSYEAPKLGFLYVGPVPKRADMELMSTAVHSAFDPSIKAPYLPKSSPITPEVMKTIADYASRRGLFPPPVYSRDYLANTGGTPITIFGHDFGALEVFGSTEGLSVFLDGVPCSSIERISSSVLTCVTPAGCNANAQLVVNAGNQRAKDKVTLAYRRPEMGVVKPNNGQPGDEITIYGHNFGRNASADGHAGEQGACIASAKIGGRPCISTRLISDDQIRCMVPNGVGKGLLVSITSTDPAQVPTSSKATFDYKPPVVKEITPQLFSSQTPYVQVTVKGEGFGPDPGQEASTESIQVKVGESVCLDVEWRSPNSLVCTCIIEAGQILRVRVGGAWSAATDASKVYMNSIPVDQITPRILPTAGGEWVSIRLMQVSRDSGSPTSTARQNSQRHVQLAGRTLHVFFGTRRCRDAKLGGTTAAPAVSCLAPKGYGANMTVAVFVNVVPPGFLQDTTNAKFYGPGRLLVSYAPPQVTGMDMAFNAGDFARITGNNFGGEDSKPIAVIGGKPCQATAWISDKVVSCKVPPGIGRKRSVVVIVGGQTSASSLIASYNSPSIQSVLPRLIPRAGGEVHILGSNFGSQVNEPTVFIDFRPCKNLVILSPIKMKCHCAGGYGSSRPVTIVVGGQSTTASVATFEPVELESVSPTRLLPTIGGTKLTLTVDSMPSAPKAEGATTPDVAITVGGKPCTDIKVQGPTAITCIAPAGQGQQQEVLLTVDRARSQLTKAVSYAPPTVKSISPIKGKAGTELTVVGSDFGNDDSKVKIYIGNQECAPVARKSFDKLTCVIPQGASACLDVHVDVANQRSARSNLAVWSYSIKSDPTENAVQTVGPATMRALNVFYLICPFKCKLCELLTNVFDELAEAMECSPIVLARANDEAAIQLLKKEKNMQIVGYPSFIFAHGSKNVEHLGAVDSVDALRSWLIPRIEKLTPDDMIRKPQAHNNRVPLYWTSPQCVP